MSSEEITSYIKGSTVSAKAGRKCVDGRYSPDQGSGMIARPGGDAGYVLALLAVSRKNDLDLTQEQCFDAVFKAVENDGGFFMHTDQHADLIGCGHLAKAASSELGEKYGVDSEDVRKLITYALHKNSPKLHTVILEGDHKEQGVFVVDSSDFTVLSNNPELKQMYFVYDEKRDDAFMEELVTKLAIEGVTYEDMKMVSDIQLHITLELLAADLPVYQISLPLNG